MAKWDLSKLPEGRKPLDDSWFRERAQMQERIAELEAMLAKAMEALQDADQVIMAAMNNLDLKTIASFFNRMSDIRTTIAELKERSDE